jgi:hypothetical protein
MHCRFVAMVLFTLIIFIRMMMKLHDVCVEELQLVASTASQLQHSLLFMVY